MLRKSLVAFLLCAAAASHAAAPKAPQEIVFRHALTGESAALLVDLVGRFNAEGKGDKVVLQHVSMAEDLHRLPHIALLDDDEYQQFFDGRPRMLPLYKVMSGAREKFDAAGFYPVIADVVEDGKGRIEALPLALSVPLLFYNKDALRKAKADPDRPPKTWWEVQTVAGQLFDAGYRCPFTSSNMAWVQLENVSTLHNEPVANGEKSGKARLALNGLVQVKHIALLSSWYKSFYFRYFGRGREADEKFVSGECGMLTSDSSLYPRLARAKPFDFGIADLPYYDDVRDAAPGRVLPDGPALWVLAGKKAPEYKVVAHFIAFLLRPQVQREWVGATGFLPMTPAALDALAADGVAHDFMRKVTQRLSEKRFVTAVRPKAMPGLSRVRAILNEELEAVWANRKPAKEALDTAVLRGNAVMGPTDGAPGR